MNGRVLWIVAGVGVAALVAVAVLRTVPVQSGGAGTTLQPDPTVAPAATAAPSPTPRRSTRAPGSPAIPPTQAGVPAFSEEDVRRYALANPVGYADRSAPPPVLETVEFLTEGELRQRFRTDTGRLDDELLVLVRWSGHFLVAGPCCGEPYRELRAPRCSMPAAGTCCWR